MSAAAFPAVRVVDHKAVFVIIINEDEMSRGGKIAGTHWADDGASLVKILFYSRFIQADFLDVYSIVRDAFRHKAPEDSLTFHIISVVHTVFRKSLQRGAFIPCERKDCSVPIIRTMFLIPWTSFFTIRIRSSAASTQTL